MRVWGVRSCCCCDSANSNKSNQTHVCLTCYRAGIKMIVKATDRMIAHRTKKVESNLSCSGIWNTCIRITQLFKHDRQKLFIYFFGGGGLEMCHWHSENLRGKWVEISFYLNRKCEMADTCSCSCKQSGKANFNLPLGENLCSGQIFTSVWAWGHVLLVCEPLPSDLCDCSYLVPEAPGCFGGPSSAGGTCADQSIAVADTDRSCCCLSEKGA